MIAERLYAPNLLVYIAKVWLNSKTGKVDVKDPVLSADSFKHLLQSTRACIDPTDPDMRDYARIDFPRAPLRELEEREHMLPAMLEVFEGMVAAAATSAEQSCSTDSSADKADSKADGKADSASKADSKTGESSAAPSKKQSAKLEKVRAKFLKGMAKLTPSQQYFAAILTVRHGFFEPSMPPLPVYRSWASVCLDGDGQTLFSQPCAFLETVCAAT